MRCFGTINCSTNLNKNIKLDIRLDSIDFMGFREGERERGEEIEREISKMSFASFSAPLSQTLGSVIDSRIISWMHPSVLRMLALFTRQKMTKNSSFVFFSICTDLAYQTNLN